MNTQRKKEIYIIIGIALLAILSLIVIQYRANAQKEKAHMVEIRHYLSSNYYEVVKEFNPNEDATYHVDGDYGGLEVEVKDGRWHVINAICPNHDCEGMGWAGVGEILPITCLPNQIVVQEKTE